jgi:8-oxo-dGTP diphosphatase
MSSSDLVPPPSLGVLAVVIHEDRLLLARRTNEPDAGCWGFPGGYVESGETLAEAAVRELQEETGIVSEAHSVIDLIEDISTDEVGRVTHHFVLLALRCDWISGEPKAASDVNALRWADEADLNDENLFACKGLHRIAAKAGFCRGRDQDG